MVSTRSGNRPGVKATPQQNCNASSSPASRPCRASKRKTNANKTNATTPTQPKAASSFSCEVRKDKIKLVQEFFLAYVGCGAYLLISMVAVANPTLIPNLVRSLTEHGRRYPKPRDPTLAAAALKAGAAGSKCLCRGPDCEFCSRTKTRSTDYCLSCAVVNGEGCEYHHASEEGLRCTSGIQAKDATGLNLCETHSVGKHGLLVGVKLGVAVDDYRKMCVYEKGKKHLSLETVFLCLEGTFPGPGENGGEGSYQFRCKGAGNGQFHRRGAVKKMKAAKAHLRLVDVAAEELHKRVPALLPAAGAADGDKPFVQLVRAIFSVVGGKKVTVAPLQTLGDRQYEHGDDKVEEEDDDEDESSCCCKKQKLFAEIEDALSMAFATALVGQASATAAMVKVEMEGEEIEKAQEQRAEEQKWKTTSSGALAQCPDFLLNPEYVWAEQEEGEKVERDSQLSSNQSGQGEAADDDDSVLCFLDLGKLDPAVENAAAQATSPLLPFSV